ncbi:hypothetical protein BJ166DRAFT_492916 [Pestalotiopsis sp. NC0098]|nr:hypothetical protein BJ166DRAFT_492916 [Pestalotiopsis sp. NC0098]
MTEDDPKDGIRDCYAPSLAYAGMHIASGLTYVHRCSPGYSDKAGTGRSRRLMSKDDPKDQDRDGQQVIVCCKYPCLFQSCAWREEAGWKADGRLEDDIIFRPSWAVVKQLRSHQDTWRRVSNPDAVAPAGATGMLVVSTGRADVPVREREREPTLYMPSCAHIWIVRGSRLGDYAHGQGPCKEKEDEKQLAMADGEWMNE